MVEVTKRQKRTSAPIKRLWVVQIDHSYAGCWTTKRAAQAAARLLSRGALFAPFVVGPYVLQTPERAR